MEPSDLVRIFHRSNNQVAWVKWPSTAEQRLVCFSGPAVEVPPIGSHRVAFMSRVDAVGYVKMSPFVIDLQCRIPTSDGITMIASLSATIAALQNEDAISRIAADTYFERPSATEVTKNRIHATLQSIVARQNLEELPSLDQVQTELKAMLSKPPATESFGVVDIVVEGLDPSDSELRSHANEIRRLRNSDLKSQLEAERLSRKRQSDREQLQWQREQSLLASQDEMKIEQERHILQMQMRKMELDAQIAIAQINANAEASKAARASLEALMPMVVKGAIADGQRRVLTDIVKKQLGVSIDINTNDSSPQSDPTAKPTDFGDTGDSKAGET